MTFIGSGMFYAQSAVIHVTAEPVVAPAGLYVLVAARFLHFSSNLLSLKREQSSFISRKNRKTGIKLVSNHNRPRSPGHLDHLASRMI